MERHGLHRVPEAALPAVQRAGGPLEELEVAFGRRLEKPPLQRAGTAGEGRRHGRGRGVRVSAVDWRQLLGFWSGRGRAEGTGSER